MSPYLLNVQNCTPTWFHVKKNLRQKVHKFCQHLNCDKIALIFKVYITINFFIKIPLKYTKLLLPFISWNFYTKSTKQSTKKLSLQQNTVC